MPVEIRELIIKTEIFIGNKNYSSEMKDEDFRVLKKLVLEECKKIIAERIKKDSYKR